MKRFIWIVVLVFLMTTGIVATSGVALADDHPICNAAGTSNGCDDPPTTAIAIPDVSEPPDSVLGSLPTAPCQGETCVCTDGGGG